MNPETGEIKKFKEESSEKIKQEVPETTLQEQQEQPKKTYHKIPDGWIGLPLPGEEVEVIVFPDKKRGRMWKVVDIVEGKPGQMVLEPCVETVNKCKGKK